MPKRNKPDKKNSITFNLLYRSQHDPLIADETAPQNILVEAPTRKKSKKYKEEELKYGIYFDDDYNYLQHLRDSTKNECEWIPNSYTGDLRESQDTQIINLQNPQKLNLQDPQKLNLNDPQTLNLQEPQKLNQQNKQKSNSHDAPKLKLPSSLFQSDIVEHVGMLNKAAPSGLCLDYDPDVMAALDDDFDFDNPDNQLEDNFMELANPVDGLTEDIVGESDEEHSSDCDAFSEEETRSRFTEYSMSSSVMTRNSNLTQLDEHFENMFAEYDDAEIGALECDEIDGDMDANSDMVRALAEQFYRNKQKDNAIMREKFLNIIMEEESEDESVMDKFEVKVKEDKWDCESVLSTYSNLYNHPQVIKEPPLRARKIRVNPRTGMPECEGSRKLTKNALAKFDAEQASPLDAASSIVSRISLLSVRDKNETLEEKKMRKQKLKEYRMERRMERKANRDAFKLEKAKLEKVVACNHSNVRGIRM